MTNTTTTTLAQGELRDTTLDGPWHYKPSDGVFRGEVLDESGDLITRNDATDEIGVLLAAAPELLAALKETLPVIDDAAGDAMGKADDLRHQGLFLEVEKWERVAASFILQANSIKAALAKADGRAGA